MRVGFYAVTTTLGPGKRFALWLQGCNRRCKGCINPGGWDVHAGEEFSVQEIFDLICSKEDLTGVSISGGEPFLQYEELCKLIFLIKEKTSLDIMLFSGYTLEQLEQKYGINFEQLKSFLDIFIDGEYVESLNTGSAYRGSDNQRIFFFTPKYQCLSREFLESKKRDFSFEIKENGDVYFIGIPPVGFYEKFLQKLGELR